MCSRICFSYFYTNTPRLFTGWVYVGVQIGERFQRVFRACVLQSVKKKWKNTWYNPMILILRWILVFEMWLATLVVSFLFTHMVLLCSFVFIVKDNLVYGFQFWRVCTYLYFGLVWLRKVTYGWSRRAAMFLQFAMISFFYIYVHASPNAYAVQCSPVL